MHVIFELSAWTGLAFLLRTLFSTTNPYIEIAANSAPYLAVLVFFAAWIAARRAAHLSRALKAAGSAVIITWSLVRVWQALPFVWVYASDAVCLHPYKLFYANVLTENQNHRLLKAALEREDPEIVGLLEVDEAWLTDLALGGRYPHNRLVTRKDNFGIALFSKHPFVTEPLVHLPGIRLPIVDAEVAFPEGTARVTVFHTTPPVAAGLLKFNRRLQDEIIAHHREWHGPLILMGDLNATWFSHQYVHWKRGLQANNVFEGRGWVRTWNALQPIERFTLDHIFTRGPVGVSSVRRLEAIDSDHFPLVVEVCLNGKPP